jgi:hypothetical protein
LFDMAVGSKKEGLKSGFVEHGLWDKIVFSKVKVLNFAGILSANSVVCCCSPFHP